MEEKLCFAEKPRDLYIECVARGYVAAARQYPHVLSIDESFAAAHVIPNVLRSQVCCIPEDAGYHNLCVNAWYEGYRALCTSQESQIAQMVLALKPIPEDEALALARYAFRQEDVTAVAEAYTRYRESRTPA